MPSLLKAPWQVGIWGIDTKSWLTEPRSSARVGPPLALRRSGRGSGSGIHADLQGSRRHCLPIMRRGAPGSRRAMSAAPRWPPWLDRVGSLVSGVRAEQPMWREETVASGLRRSPGIPPEPPVRVGHRRHSRSSVVGGSDAVPGSVGPSRSAAPPGGRRACRPGGGVGCCVCGRSVVFVRLLMSRF